MKKLFMLIALFLLSAAGFATTVIPLTTVTMTKGTTYIAITTSASMVVAKDSTKYIYINAPILDNATQQDVYVNMTTLTGSPSVQISLEGKKFSGDSWTEVVSQQTWTTTAIKLASTSATRYRYFAIKFIASSAAQTSWPSTVQFKVWAEKPTETVSSLTDGTATFTAGALTGATTAAFSGRITGTGGATLTGAATNINASSNFATNINTGTTNAALSLGGGSGTVAVNSSTWDVSTAGVATGLTNVTITNDGDNIKLDPTTDLHVVDVQVNSASKFSVDSVGNVVAAGTIDNAVTNSAAGGDKGINEAITQDATALTGNLIGAGIVATNGTSAATGGVIYGIEAKARAANSSNEGNTIGRLDGVYASVDAKNKTATIMRAFEASLDGGAGGSSDEAVAFEAFNNSSATQTASYAFSANGGTASGHKAYTADIRLQNGETISNATDGTVAISAVTQAGLKLPAPILNTDGTETLDATMSGKMCIASKSDGATTITIPDPSSATVGVVYYLLQTANQNLVVTATTANGNSIVCDGVATSDAVTISTADHLIGAGMIVIGISATQWYVGGLNPESVLTPEAAD